MKKVNKAQQIREYLKANPEATTAEITKKFKVASSYVYAVKHKMKPKKIIIGKHEAEVAKKLGIPLEEYAKQKMNLAYEVSKGRPKIRMQSTQDREWQPPELLPMPKLEAGREVGGMVLTDVGNGNLRWIAKSDPKLDNVNHPPHYKTGGIETIDFIEAKDLGYHLGNVIKYVSRAKHKGNELEDLKKAQWYLERAIMKLHI